MRPMNSSKNKLNKKNNKNSIFQLMPNATVIITIIMASTNERTMSYGRHCWWLVNNWCGKYVKVKLNQIQTRSRTLLHLNLECKMWNGTSEIYVGYTKQQRDGQRSKDKCYDQIIVMCPFENNLFSWNWIFFLKIL